jgi:hypothetical protein
MKKERKKCIVISCLSVDEAKNIFSHISEKITCNKELVIFSYENHLPQESIFHLNVLRTELTPKGSSLDKEFFDICLKHKSKILHLLTRQMTCYNNLNYSEIEYLYFSTLLNCAEWFERYDISLVFSRSYPQFAFDYLFFLYCEIKKIPYIFEYICPYVDVASFYSAKTDGQQNFVISRIYNNQKKNYSNSIPKDHNVSSIVSKITSSIEHSNDSNRVSYYNAQEMFEEKIHAKLTKVLWGVFKVGVPEIIRELFYKDSVHFTRFHIQSTREGKAPKHASALSIVNKSINSFYSAKKALRSYKKLSKNCDFGLSASVKVLYIAHQEPEATILVEGGKFFTNFEAVKYVQSIMPDDAIIYYKEHDANFYYYDLIEKGTAPENRPTHFYDLTACNENIQFVPIEDTNKKRMLDEVDVVVTVCGTFAIEASMYGVPSIVLSNPWYMESGVDNLITPDAYTYELLNRSLYDQNQIREQWKNFISNVLQSGFYSSTYSAHIDVQDQPNRYDIEYLTALSETIDSMCS